MASKHPPARGSSEATRAQERTAAPPRASAAAARAVANGPAADPLVAGSRHRGLFQRPLHRPAGGPALIEVPRDVLAAR